MLFGYAITFSLAYVKIGAGLGALLLFGAVQLTMIGWGLVKGERPGAAEWSGLALALVGLLLLTNPSVSGSPPGGMALMLLAGLGWGIYSLRGRRAADPLQTTASNFVRTRAVRNAKPSSSRSTNGSAQTSLPSRSTSTRIAVRS